MELTREQVLQVPQALQLSHHLQMLDCFSEIKQRQDRLWQPQPV